MKISEPCVCAAAVLVVCSLTACVATTADAALAVAKVPFKTGGAIVDLIGDDEGDDWQAVARRAFAPPA